MVERILLEIEIKNKNLWTKLQRVARNLNLSISDYIERILYLMKKYEEMQKDEPKFEDVMKVFSLKNITKMPKYDCGYDCPHWDSGQGIEHSSCLCPCCMKWECSSRWDYKFNLNDLYRYANYIRDESDADEIIAYEPEIFAYREILLKELPSKETTVNKGFIKRLLEHLENASVIINDFRILI